MEKTEKRNDNEIKQNYNVVRQATFTLSDSSDVLAKLKAELEKNKK